MTSIIGLDLETTGVNTKEDRITEIGLVEWDMVSNKPITIFNSLVKYADEPLISEKIEKITGISQDLLERKGRDPKAVLTRVAIDLSGVDYVVAHNGNQFDRPLLEAEFDRHGIVIPKVHWIDSMLDVPYPEDMTVRKLGYLACEHGFLNPFAHRAVFDVLTMLRVCAQYDWEAIIQRSKEASVVLMAVCQKPWEDSKPAGEKDTDKVKELGFRYNPDRKIWVKTVKESDIDMEVARSHIALKVISAG